MSNTEGPTEVGKSTYYWLEYQYSTTGAWCSWRWYPTKDAAISAINRDDVQWRIIKVEEVKMAYPPELVEPSRSARLFSKWILGEFGLTIEPSGTEAGAQVTVQAVYDGLKRYLGEDDGIDSYKKD